LNAKGSITVRSDQIDDGTRQKQDT